MKMIYRMTLLMILAIAVTSFADGTKSIDATDAAAVAAAKDTTATVQGKVASAQWSPSGKVCSIEFENAPKFMAAAFEKQKDKLDAAFGGDFAKQIKGATVKVTGKIAAYGGHSDQYKDAMQIVIKTTGQITVVAAASQPADSGSK